MQHGFTAPDLAGGASGVRRLSSSVRWHALGHALHPPSCGKDPGSPRSRAAAGKASEGASSPRLSGAVSVKKTGGLAGVPPAEREAGLARAAGALVRTCAQALSGFASLYLTTVMALGPAHAEAPKRIVSLDLCTDQLLIDLVPRDRIAAVTHLAADPSVSAIPEKARGLPVTRGGAEDVLAHNPDLILAGPWGVAGTVSLLQRLGRNVVIVPLASDLDGVRTAVTTVAKAVGEPEAGARAIAAFDARLEQARQAQTPVRPSALIYQVGGSASAPGTLADAAIAAAGYRNAALSYTTARTGQVPLEAIVARPPQLLVLASPPHAYRTVVADNLRHPALAQMAQRTASVTLPWRLWLCGTPHIATAIEQLAAARSSLKERP